MTDIQRATALTAPLPDGPVSTWEPEQIVEASRRIAEEYTAADSRRSLLLAALGEMYWIAAQDAKTPEKRILRAAGVKTLAEYESTVLRGAHSTVGEIAKAFRIFGDLMTPDVYVDIGMTKMRDACRAVDGKNCSTNQLAKALEDVRTAENAIHARKRLEATVAGEGELTYRTVEVRCKAVDADELEQNLEDPEAHEAFETRDRGLLLNRLFQDWRSAK
jgi:hypothetical protein